MKSQEMESFADMTNTQELIDLRKRNEERAKQFIEQMGKKWVLHPANSPRKQKQNTILKAK